MDKSIWLVAGLRSPFAKLDSALKAHDAIALSVPVVQAMTANGAIRPDFAVWGTVIPNLGYSNIAREVWLDAGIDPTVPSFSTVLACSTSMAAVFQAAGMLGYGGRELAVAGGTESMSRVQFGLNQNFSDWLRRFFQARSLGKKVGSVSQLTYGDIRLHIPTVTNRTTSMSMGEHTEEMAKAWHISREAQDEIALKSHTNAVAASESGFFDDLVTPVGEVSRDSVPRADTSADKLASLKPAFDRTSGNGTLTAGNSSPLTDGAAGIWVATDDGLTRLPTQIPRVRLVDWEMAAVDIHTEGLLMAPAYAIPRLLSRHNLRFTDITLWEIHEAFAAQVLANVAAISDGTFVRDKANVTAEFGDFPWERFNPVGGSIALGHPFGATGARILSQAVKQLAQSPSGEYAVVSICADGGEGTVALLQSV